MTAVNTYLNMLGLTVTDKVTGFKGVVISISFDLYGCVQLALNPGMDKEGKLLDSQWFDANRLTIIDLKPVMERPKFELMKEYSGASATEPNGPAEKPAYNKA